MGPPHAGDNTNTPLEAGGAGHRRRPGRPHRVHPDRDPGRGDVDDWNREHVWAKSHGDFGEATGPGTDLHHLRPADVQVNSTRGNLDFDNGGSAVTNGGGSTVDSDSFE